MPGKPHGASVSEELSTVKDRFGLNGEQESLESDFRELTVSSVAEPFCWPAIAIDSLRDVFPFKSTRYDILSDS